jgi:hypothetical protein
MEVGTRNCHCQFHSTFAPTRFTLVTFRRHEGVQHHGKSDCKETGQEENGCEENGYEKEVAAPATAGFSDRSRGCTLRRGFVFCTVSAR